MDAGSALLSLIILASFNEAVRPKGGVIMNKYEIAIIAHKDKERCKRLKEEINKLEKEYDLKEEELKILKNYKKKWWE